MTSVIYKIRDKHTKLEYNGRSISVPKNGKIWNTLGKLRTFITISVNRGTDMSSWEIMEYSLDAPVVKGVNDVITPDTLMKMLSGTGNGRY